MDWWASGSHVSPSTHCMLSQSYPSLPSAPITIFLSVALKYISSVSSLQRLSSCPVSELWTLIFKLTQHGSQVFQVLITVYLFGLILLYYSDFLYMIISSYVIFSACGGYIFLCDLFYVWGVTCTLLKREERMSNKRREETVALLTMRLRKLKRLDTQGPIRHLNSSKYVKVQV